MRILSENFSNVCLEFYYGYPKSIKNLKSMKFFSSIFEIWNFEMGSYGFWIQKALFYYLYTLLFFFKKLCENLLIFLLIMLWVILWTLIFSGYSYIVKLVYIYLCVGVISYSVLIYGRIYRKQKKFQSLELQIPSKNLF